MLSLVYKRIPMKKSITQEEAIKNKGYYDKYGNWNSMLTIAQYPGKVFRGRVEVFIFDNQNNVFAHILPDKVHYRIPGGSTSIDKSFKYQVAQESKEEAGILLSNIQYTGYSYIKFFQSQFKVGNLHWEGAFNRVYVAQFRTWYEGRINSIDLDPKMYSYGHFVSFERLKRILSPDHRNALRIN